MTKLGKGFGAARAHIEATDTTNTPATTLRRFCGILMGNLLLLPRKYDETSPLEGRRKNMKKSATILAFLALSILPARAQEPPPSPMPSVELPAPLARVLTDYENAWHKKDAAALAALFAENGFVLASGSPPARGRAAIEKHYTGAGGPLALRALAYATRGDVGYIIGAYAGTKERPDEGKFTLTLEKDASGRWLIMSDMDNTNARR
jgi:ketosteroid isomerase-like protein